MNPVVPHAVTIFNGVGDGYTRATLENVRVGLTRGSGSAKGTVYVLLAYLESDKPFLPCDEWRLLSDTDKREYWTAVGDGGDIIVPRLCGECSDPLALPDALPVTNAECCFGERGLSQLVLYIGGK